MALSIDTITIDCRDPKVAAGFWSAALGYRVVEIDENEAEIAPLGPPGRPLLFQVVPEGKTVKNRWHLDLRPDRSMAHEVARLEAAGATALTRVEEGGSFWTVMGDPEGNEFCVLRGPEDGWSGEL